VTRSTPPPTHRRPLASAHELPEAIQWHEGMLLAPQHFQQLAARQEELLHYRSSLSAPFQWGVRHFKIDPVQLVDGTFRVLELEAVMPDGLLVSRLSDESADLTVDLKPRANEMKDRALTIHLAVAAKRQGRSPLDGEMARFDSIEGEAVVDENTGDGELRMPRLRPRLRLLLQEEPPQKYVSLPLGRVAYSNEAFTLTDYVPPTLRVGVSSPLGELCAGVARRLREKAAFLAEQVDSPSLAARGPQLLETQITLNALVSALPPFEALLYSAVAHPFDLYRALCAVVGRVATVGRSLVPPVFDSFDQDDPLAAFEQARDFIFQALDEGISDAFNRFPFLLEHDSFLLDFDPEWIGRQLVLAIRARDDGMVGGVDAWVENSLIGSRSKIRSMRERRIAGAGRKKVEALRDLIPARGTTLYLLTPEPEYIVPGETLVIRNLDDLRGLLRPADITLHVRNPSLAGDGS
jgi:type VI secretion system protein ImpJ